MAKSEPTVAILVPRREDGGHRDRLWAFCKKAWEDAFPEWPIIEGHHRPGRGDFSRAKAVNSAYSKSLSQGERFDVFLVLDADTLVHPGAVRKAVHDAYNNRAKVSPFTRRRYCSEEQTEEILAGGTLPEYTKYVDGINVSTCFAISHDLWTLVRGFDKRFKGWGGEDTAFDSACYAMGTSWRNAGDSWHLWHEPSPEADRTTQRWKEAKLLADRYIDARDNRPAMERLIAEHRGPDQTLVMCKTYGTDIDRLVRTLEYAEQTILPERVGRRVVYLDNRSMGIYHAVCKATEWTLWDWEIVRAPAGLGPMGIEKVAIGSGQPWIFLFEEDAYFDGDVDLAAAQANRDLPNLMTRREFADRETVILR